MKRSFLVVLLLVGPTGISHAEPAPQHRRLWVVPFTAVKVQDDFWAARIETNRKRSLPHNFQWCEKTGRFSNFAKAAGLVDGQFEGIYFNDSDVYKVLQGASCSLADQPDDKLDQMTDAVIAKIAAAQHENGYLNTYYTLVEPDKKWTDCAVRHELYCAGHLIEAGVDHWRATGKRTLLDVAIRFADRIDDIFGPEARYDVPGHEEIELALVKLYEATGESRYLDLARFFLEIRGDDSQRKLYGPYCQDHKPIREQDEIVGHAVRAMYLYSGVADVAAYTGDQGMVDAMHRLWNDVARQKMYLTGGVGARHRGESFGDDYELPNEAAYAETCAAIGLALWSHRLNLLHGDAQYADVLERAMYNGILAGVSLDGTRFFYVNPLASTGRHHRQPFFGCACCPTNVVRFMPSVPGYVYAESDEAVYVNLYVASTAKLSVGPTPLRLVTTTRYPWEGRVAITLEPKAPAEFALCLRVPSWCEGATFRLNGTPLNPTVASGYARIERRWQPGDQVELDMPLPIRRIEAHPRVEANRGRVALQRGPIVYCFEQVDNPTSVRNLWLPHDPKLRAEWRRDLLGGVMVIRGVARDGHAITAVPYYAWNHREPGEMIVWVRQDGKSPEVDVDARGWEDKLYRPLDPAMLGPSIPLSLVEAATLSASHCYENDTVTAIADGIDPADSSDHSIPRFTWWPRRGTTEWVQYDFDKPRTVQAVEVYWFDDERQNRQCRTPQNWRLLYRDGERWEPVAEASAYGTALDRPNRVTFEPVTTTALRIEAQLKPTFSGGVLEWRVDER